MKLIDAILEVLRDAGEPLHYVKIAELIIERGLWKTTDLKPWAQVNSRISVEIKEKGSASRFVRTDRGMYGLNPNPTDKADPGPRDKLPDTKPDGPALDLTDKAGPGPSGKLFLEQRVDCLEAELKEVRKLAVLALSTLADLAKDSEER